MFKVIEDPQFVEDVPVDVPDGEGWTKGSLRTRFRALRVSEMDQLEKNGGATALIDRAVVGFENLVDDDGNPLPGDGAMRAQLLEYAFVRSALIKVFYVAQAGLRLGNSAPSAEPGPLAN